MDASNTIFDCAAVDAPSLAVRVDVHLDGGVLSDCVTWGASSAALDGTSCANANDWPEGTFDSICPLGTPDAPE